MSPLYTGQLDNERQLVFKKLTAFADSFTLAGGTAIMLQIGHRQSYDFDCFSLHHLSPNLIQKARRIFGKATSLKTKTSEIVTVRTPESVDVTFVYHPYQPLKPPVNVKPISLFHLDDLVANKAYTLGRRPAWRDYVDLFIFLKWKLYDLSTIVKFSQKKFTGEFNEKLFLQQLTYFVDLEVVPIVFLKNHYAPEEIKMFLEKQAESYLKTVLSV